MTQAHATPCSNCDRKGLPILFTRYAAAYCAKDTPGMRTLRQFEAQSPFKPQPKGVSMKSAVSNVRMLRPGYLYTRMDHPVLGLVWDGYIVHPHGYLARFDVWQPELAQAHPACEMEIRGANMSMVWVPDAKQVREFHYLFHPTAIDLEHLMKVIEPGRDKYMHGFDVAGWAGGNTKQEHSCEAAALPTQVVEFAAVHNEALRQAMEPQMFGLMGANPVERGWGDYERELFPTQRISLQRGPTYSEAHGKRLSKIIEFLWRYQGAVVACEDAMGVAQELGHQQGEAQRWYTRWQAGAAHENGGALAPLNVAVSNEWALQAATGAQEIIKLARTSAAQSVDKVYEAVYRRHAALYPDPPELPAHERTWREQARRKSWDEARQQRLRAVEEGFGKYFDAGLAQAIVQRQAGKLKECEGDKSTLWQDQLQWLQSDALMLAMARFSEQPSRIGRPGGGADLSMELAQCLAGCEHNSAGARWLAAQSLSQGRGPLARMASFGTQSMQEAMAAIEAHPFKPAPEPAAEPAARVADGMADALKPLAGYVALGDKALAFLDDAAVKSWSASTGLRQRAWPTHVASLLSVRLIHLIEGLSATQAEAALVRALAQSGLLTLGGNSAKYAADLGQAAREQARRASQQVAQIGKAVDVRPGMHKARAAGMAGVFDLGMAAIKLRQLAVKGDARTAWEMTGSLLQAIGSVADLRAKAYEETIHKSVKAANLMTDAPLKGQLSELQLLKLRQMAFKFLLPAAVISAVMDGMDAVTSADRGQRGLAIAQASGIVGTTFTIVGTGIAAYGGATWLAAAFGLVGAALAIGSTVFVLILKEEEWVNWLVDGPLNPERIKKKERPIHPNLQETLQKLANVKAELAIPA